MLQRKLGHFNVFDMQEFSGPYAQPLFYTRKNYFKSSLLTGRRQPVYADKVIPIEPRARSKRTCSARCGALAALRTQGQPYTLVPKPL